MCRIWFFCRSGNSLNFFIKKSLVLDEAGWYFEVEWEDVNHDGKKDILATTWSRTGENGQSMAYELNGLNWQDKNAWIRYKADFKHLKLRTVFVPSHGTTAQ